MRKTLIILLISLTFISCSESNTTEPEDKQTTYSYLELPDTTLGQIVHHHNYTLSYAEEYEQAYWVAYELVIDELVKNYERTDDFIIDPFVTTGSAEASDYKGSGYDRGHLMPAAVCTWDSTAMAESFFYSNVSPQNASFNRGVWSRLEDLERELVAKYDTVWVVVTPIFNNVTKYIGANGVAVPSDYGRAFLVNDNGVYKGIAFILSNEAKSSDYDIIENASYTIDALEKRIGIDLFFQLDNQIEDILESKISKEIFEGL